MASIEKRATFAVCLAALLTLPLSVIADDQGQHSGGNGGGSVSRIRETAITVRTARVYDRGGQPTGNNPNAGGIGSPRARH